MTPPGDPRCVLMTADAVGGVWQYSLELCRGLAEKDIRVVLATIGPRPSAAQRAEVRQLGNVTLCESDFRLEWMDEPWTDVMRAGEWLLELAQRYDPDLIHLNGYAHAVLPWSAPVVVVGHSCVFSWWQACRGEMPPAAWSRYRFAVCAGLRRADAVVAPTRSMRDALVSFYGSASDLSRMVIIPNGRDPERYAARAGKEPFVLGVGRLWDEAKNAQALADVAPELAWPVKVAGDTRGPDGGVRALAGVDMLGRCDAVVLADHYARAAIYAAPARYEPFGLCILEAALSGCALVLGDIASLRELWHGAACFVPPDDRAALRDALNELIAGPVKRSAMAAQAAARAREFSAARMTGRTLALYRRLRAARLPATAAFTSTEVLSA